MSDEHGSSRVQAGFARHVQDALAHLYDPISLQVHPLARALRLPARPATQAGAAGRVLRQRLLDAIESLRPTAALQTSARSNRGYELLRLRYVEGLDVNEVQSRLAIGKSQYYQDHAQAVGAVVSVLAAVAGSEPEAQVPPAADAAPGVSPSGAPAPLLALIGRTRELASILELLTREDAPVRLLTLTGPPGAGKTRLAQDVMARLGPSYPGGAVRFVDLAAVRESEAALAAIAQALGADSLAEASRSSNPCRLLVLDNCEQVLSIGPHLATLVRTQANLRVLTTSRVAFDVYGERQFPVPPLSLPENVHDMAAVAGSDAVSLFLERAQAVQPDLVLAEYNAAVIATICVRLDGLPLALELAAARTRTLSLEVIEARLADRLGLLTSGPRDRPPRQQTLRGALAWSYDLLAPELQVLFRRLAVFGGSCSASAVAAVCYGWEDTRPGSNEQWVLDRLADLTAASLLHPAAAGPRREPRFRMLVTIRDYAREQLAATGEFELLQSRHADYFLAAPAREAGQTEGLPTRLAAVDEDNMRAALQSLLSEMVRAVDWPGGPRQRAMVLDSLGFLEFGGGDYASAEQRYRESLALFAALGDAAGQALVLSHLGDVARAHGGLAEARACYEQSLALPSGADPADRHASARALVGLAHLAKRAGDPDSLRALAERARQLASGLDSPEERAAVLDDLAALTS